MGGELRQHQVSCWKVLASPRLPEHSAIRESSIDGDAGRGGGIRTPDPLLPKQMRYQTALRPDPAIVSRKVCFQPHRNCLYQRRQIRQASGE